MGTLIDSSVLIAAERKKLNFAEKLSELADEPIAIAAITASELLHGVYRAIKAEQRSHRQAFVERLLASIPILPFDIVVARIHAELWGQLAVKGINVGTHDLLIASTAIAAGYNVATRDERSFPKIPGLSTTIW